MSKERENEKEVKKEEMELGLDELDAVSGGALRNVEKQETHDIDQSTINRI